MHNAGGRISLKALLIAVLALLMLWPLWRVESLVMERQSVQQQAYDVIAAGFGGPQIVGAPILVVETEERSVSIDPTTNVRTQVLKRGPALHLLPDDVQIVADVAAEERSKGIPSFPVYVTKVVMTGQFKAEAIGKLLSARDDLTPQPGSALVQLPLSGAKYLRTLTDFEIGGQALHATSGELAGFPALSAPIEGLARASTLPFRVEFQLAGSNSLHFLPLGSQTAVTARVAWPHPDFDGAFLPVSHVLGPQGYSARWSIMELNRSLPQISRGANPDHAALLATAFGVRLFQPADLYAQNYRAVRYGILFVAITFACFFAWEHRSRAVRLHPMQYLLVGLALAMFYLLLLAFSEHLGFVLAYWLAAFALVVLVTFYLAGATSSRPAALGIGAALALSYSALYVILLSDDYAMLLGSLLLLIILGVVMMVTRKLDWSTVGGEP
jgi:inner membrane protein